MRIDIHNHADYYGYGIEKTLRNMDENSIDITCLLSWEAPASDCDPANARVTSVFPDGPIPFRRCVDYYERAPERFMLGFCPDPRRPDAIGRLKSAVAEFGICMCAEFKLRMMLDNPDAVRMFRYCAEAGLPVLVHIDYELNGREDGYPWPNWWYGGGVEALERALILCPETTFIGHAPGFWARISGDGRHLTESYPAGRVAPGGKLTELLDSYPNLCCDISAGSGHNALSRDLEFTKTFIEKYQDRIMYGRDYFDSKHAELIDGLGLEESVRDKIYFKNALRILNTASRPDLC